MITYATFAGGCFWCTEAIFKRLRGVAEVKPGYSGGTVKNPTYHQVTTGTTGHAEAIQITFDPDQILFEKLLDVFFATHNPTTKNQQGADRGTQYRSAIFYHDEAQKQAAEAKIRELSALGAYQQPIVTEVKPFTAFYEAEDYHKNYYDKNEGAPYCSIVIDPKIHKLLQEFTQDIKEEYAPSI